MKSIFYSILMAVFLFSNSSLAALSEAEKIEQLLKAIEVSDLTFIRNDVSYPAKEASTHLRDKLRAAENSLLAPRKKDWTAVMFIDRVASKSSFSGKDYLVKLIDGRIFKARDWLTSKLAEIEANNP